MSRPTDITVTTRVEDTRRVFSVPGSAGTWEFSLWKDHPDGEPRIRDTDAARRLGYKYARKVRVLIKRIWPDSAGPYCRPTVGRQPVGPNGKGTRAYTVEEFWLTEAELLKLIARSETAPAEAVLDEMIAVYMAVRRQLALPTLAAPLPTLPAPQGALHALAAPDPMADPGLVRHRSQVARYHAALELLYGPEYERFLRWGGTPEGWQAAWVLLAGAPPLVLAARYAEDGFTLKDLQEFNARTGSVHDVAARFGFLDHRWLIDLRAEREAKSPAPAPAKPAR